MYAVDWLGFGRSSRPATNFSSKNIGEVEEFFVESLEQWRAAMGFEKLTLCGHSLGATLLLGPGNLGKRFLLIVRVLAPPSPVCLSR